MRAHLTAWAALAVLLLAVPAWASPDEIFGTVAYVADDAVYVDQGSDAGLQTGDLGSVQRDGTEIARVEIVSATKRQARARVLRQSEAPRAGDRVVFSVERRATPEGAGEVPEAGPGTIQAPEAFMPLLERQKQRAQIVPPQDIFHGRLGVTQLIQVDSQGDMDYATTLVGFHGMLDRINGSAWALRWNANASYRTGSAFSGTDQEAMRLDLYGLELRRRLGEDGQVRFGRFVPQGLGAAGILDGAGADVPVGAQLRLGGALGLRPTREDLAPSGKEPTGLAYITTSTPAGSPTRYSGTTGVLVSAYGGDLDRLALLTDQFVSNGGLRAGISAEVDLDVGERAFHTGTRLTRLDAHASWSASAFLTVRANVDHYERLDTAAERDVLDVLDPDLFNNDFWRYGAGIGLTLPARLRLDAEVARIEGGATGSSPNWRVSLSQSDPFGALGGYASVTVYNLQSFAGDGVGGLLDAQLPLGGGRWYVRPGLGLRSFDQPERGFEIADAHVQIEFLPTSDWEAHLGITYLSGTVVDDFLLEIGFAHRW